MSEPVSGGMKPWVRVLLGVSLAANLLIVGLATGAALRFGGSKADRPPPPTGVSIYLSLPSEDRKVLRTKLREVMPARQDRMAEAEELSRVLATTPFDRAALEEVMRVQSGQRAQFQSAMEGVWLEHVAEMDDATRAAYAERLVELAKHGRHHGKDKYKDKYKDKDRD